LAYIVCDGVTSISLSAAATTAPTATATAKEDFFTLYERCVETGI
jgi:hypothetical protein